MRERYQDGISYHIPETKIGKHIGLAFIIIDKIKFYNSRMYVYKLPIVMCVQVHLW